MAAEVETEKVALQQRLAEKQSEAAVQAPKIVPALAPAQQIELIQTLRKTTTGSLP